ncbi:MAG: hypothetical protein HPY69_20695 [Armatimonadetes bacterium]|nr:hypothetical protein [Armatimonadota bacterium]
MVRGMADEVPAQARKLIDRVGCDYGGCIAQWYASPQAVEHDPEKIETMSQEFVN